MTTQAFRPLKTKQPPTAVNAHPSTSLAAPTTSASTAASTALGQITFTQSLSVVRTMMAVSFGCIAYLRGLLPEENFSDNSTHSLSGQLGSSSQDKKGAGASEGKGGLKAKTIKRNYSPEGDKLLDYLEKGVMDAIEKKYLRALVMSIYMDPAEPSNVIETYTFNFTYPLLEDGTAVPVLEVSSSVRDLKLSEEQRGGGTGGLTGGENVRREGGPITVGAVKKAVRHMIKQLILLTQNLADLPRKRYLSLKTFYEDHTPEDYQPPLFRDADLETERLFFATRSRNQAPELSTISGVDTGHHGVQVTIRSITDLLPPSSLSNDDLPFDGRLPPNKTAREVEAMLEKDEERLGRDGERRRVCWNAEEEVWKARKEESDLGSDMPAYADLPPSPPAFGTAFAVRTAVDGYQALDSDARKRYAKGKGRAEEEEEEMDIVEGEESGLEQQPLANLISTKGAVLEETQRIESAPSAAYDSAHLGESRTKSLSVGGKAQTIPSQVDDNDDPIASFSTGADAQPSSQPMDVDSPTPAQPLVSKKSSGPSKKPHRKTEDRYLAELGIDPSQTASLLATPTRTTRRASTALPTPVQGQAQTHGRQRSSVTYVDLKPRTRADTSTNAASIEHEHETEDASGRTDVWEPCWCGDEGDELDMVGCDGQDCRRFMHVFCVGGHSTDEYKDGTLFLCPDCRLREDARTDGWSQLKFDECMRLFAELALFRRALRIAFDDVLPASLTIFAQKLHCSTADARGVFDRLQQEGFIKLLSSKPQTKKGAKKSAKKDHFVVDRSKEDEAELYFGANGQKREDSLFKLGGKGDVKEDQELERKRSRESSILSVTDDENAPPPAVKSYSVDDIQESQSQTIPETYHPPPARPLLVAKGPYRAGQMPPPPSQGSQGAPSSLSNPGRQVLSPSLGTPDRGQAGEKGKRRSLASAFEDEERLRRVRIRVGMNRSGLDLTT